MESVEAWWLALDASSDLARELGKVWIPGWLALAGAVAIPLVALAGVVLVRRRRPVLRIVLAPLAGGLAGGFLAAIAEHTTAEACLPRQASCLDYAGPVEIVLFLLAAMACIALLNLCLPLAAVSRILYRRR